MLLLPDGRGGIGGALLGTGGKDWPAQSPLLTGVLAGALPEGDYRFASPLPDPELAALGFLAGLLSLHPLQDGEGREGEAPRRCRRARAEIRFWRWPRRSISAAISSTRRPTISGPAELETAARELANAFGASIKVTEGSALLADNFPMIHAVGRASDRAPRLIDLRWGSEHAPKVTIVGKGICFDTGGLDIKPSSAMALMKKDMGGAASALAFALLVMRTKLAGAASRADPRRREQHRRQCLPAGRRAAEPQRHDRRDRQYRRRRAPRAGRRHRLADEEAPDYLVTIATLTGRRARGARPRSAAALYR